jgi:2-octaprenyl-6-methoxyphenol hydroxylase
VNGTTALPAWATWRLAVIGAGPVGLALALHAARLLPDVRLTVYDARAADQDVAADPRALALSLGSVQFLQRLGCFPADEAAAIEQVMVSQVPPSPGAPEVWLRARELGVPQLGAVVAYGALVARLQRAWLAQAGHGQGRLAMRFGTPVQDVRAEAGAMQLDTGAAVNEAFDLVVVAEGGLFATQAPKSIARGYGQVAWVGTAMLAGATPGVAIERFTRRGPLALLPLRPLSPESEATPGTTRAALVWCVDETDDPVRELDDGQRIAVMNALLPAAAGRIVGLSALKDFKLGLNAERTLARGGIVRIGNAAQTLHPVAGQGLNLGLRDAFGLVAVLREARSIEAALRRVEWARAPDRWGVIGVTDFLARSFTWQWPGAGALRAAGLSALEHAPLLKRTLARSLMFGWR